MTTQTEIPEDRESDADEHLIGEMVKVAQSLGRMFPGVCEVVLHDLRDPDHAIRAIENNLSGRQVGDSATELGLRRIQDPEYPDVVQNYANQFPDGRAAKSTSIGIRNTEGRFIAALCLNFDVSVLSPLSQTLGRLVATEDFGPSTSRLETLLDRNGIALRTAIIDFAVQRGTTPRGLSRRAKKELVRELREAEYFASHNAGRIIAAELGVSRATVYNYASSEAES
ncbi:MAG: PAS domain-containing protein [Microbacterium sp.]